MPIYITKNGTEYSLVPAPLVTFNKQIYNNVGRPGLGSEITVTLQGTLLPTHGNPHPSGFSTDAWTTTSAVEIDEIRTGIPPLGLLDVTIKKQEYIRNLFTNPVISGIAQPIKVSIRGWSESPVTPSTGLSFYGFVDDISFDSDSRWVNPTTYSINMRASSFTGSAAEIFGKGTEHLESGSGYFISNLTDTFDIQEDSRTTLKFRTVGLGPQGMQKLENSAKIYNVNRSITAVGSPVYDTNGGYLYNLEPWQQASGFIYSYLNVGTGIFNTSTSQSKTQALTQFQGNYKAANFSYQESIDKEAGSYSITETFILYSGDSPVIENITINHDVSENGTHSVSVQGTIQGLNTVSGFAHSGNSYQNAYRYLTGVIDTGIPSTAYYFGRGLIRGVIANPASPDFIPWLHPRPLSKSFAHDLNAGSISYTYSFDDRPANIIPGSVSESIQINDTYPGELFSVTPVIGRSQPVLQYLNSRSEYKRNLSINITMGQTGDPTFNGVDNQGNIVTSVDRRSVLQRMFFNEKPSISQTDALNDIFQAANPVNDPTFQVANGKCFHSAPTETWDPRTRNYSYSIEWTYERTTNV